MLDIQSHALGHSAPKHAAGSIDRRAAYVEELIALVKWSLSREENAAATISRLSYRVEPDSELAKTARTYAAEVRQFATRLRRLLPDEHSTDSREAEIGLVTDAVIQSMSHEKAAEFLIRFLLQHAETASEVLQSAGSRLHSKAAEMLWRKADRERRKLAAWIRDLEMQLRTRAEHASAKAESATGGEPAAGNPLARDALPRQLVIWM